MRHLDDGRLQAWLDRDRSGIDAGEALEIEGHLAGCEACAARMAELEELNFRTLRVLASAGPMDAGIPDFRAVVERSRSTSPGPRRGRPWTAAGWAASLVAALGLGWLTNDLLRTDPGAPPSPAAEAPAVAAMPDTGPPAAEATGDAPSPVERARAEPSVPEAGDRGAPPAVAATPAPERAEAAPAAAAAPEPERAEAAPAAPRLAPAPEDAVVVRGRVTDDEGQPVASARVFAPGAAVGDLTREDGTFSLSLPPSAADPTTRHITLTAQLIGFRSARREIVLGAADTVTADFHLSPAIVALQEMVVTTGTPGPIDSARRGDAQVTAAIYASDEAEKGGDARPEAWTAAGRAEAEARAGFTLLAVPELEILSIEVGEVEGAVLVRLRHALPSGADLTLVQREDAASIAEAATTLDGRPAVSVRKGELLVTASAPISPDSLRVLLDRLR